MCIAIGAVRNGDAAPVEEIAEHGVAQCLGIVAEEHVVVGLERRDRHRHMRRRREGQQRIADQRIGFGDHALALFQHDRPDRRPSSSRPCRMRFTTRASMRSASGPFTRSQCTSKRLGAEQMAAPGDEIENVLQHRQS